MNYILHAYALQDIGQRTNQEDCFYPPFIDPCYYDESKSNWSFYDGMPHTDDRLFIVCDGMGGHDRGEVASQTVTQTMSKSLLHSVTAEGTFHEDMIRKAVDDALTDLASQDDPAEKMKMGTTMTVLQFHAHGATVGHIGDSRVYHFRPAQPSSPARMLFRTDDHTYVNDMVHNGQMTVTQALNSPKKHILSRCMMSYQKKRPEVDIHTITDIQPGDVFLLCSDGIYEHMDDEQLCKLLTDPNYSDVQRIQMLLHECLDNHDNHTAIFIRVQDILGMPGSKKVSESALPAGTILKSEKYTYHIERVLGQGAFGLTYLVKTNVSMQGKLGTIHTGVKVALKEFFIKKEMKRSEGGEIIITSEDSKIKQYADKFRREASKLAMLSHPNIVRVLEVFETNNTIYYSMEYLPDGSLNDYINKRGGLPEIEAIGCIRQICSAVMYMHANKMLHLDIKPANVMRSVSNNALKLIDFGLSKRYEVNGDPESSANLGFGTAGYAPLEQSEGNIDSEFAPELDIYALGATYFKLLTGLVPDSAVDVLNHGLRTAPLVKKHVSQQSIDAIKAAMEPTKAKRLKSVESFLNMLPRIDDETVFPQKKEHKYKWLWAAVAALLVIAATGGGLWWWNSSSSSSATHGSASSSTELMRVMMDIPMVEVEGGTFIMGCDADKNPEADADELVRRKITLSTFYMSKYEVTQSLWHAVMEETVIGKSKNANYPVFNASWNDIRTFINTLNKKTGRHFRLPTEAEWEYAARGGRHGKSLRFSGANRANAVAWSSENSHGKLHPVGTLEPNELGLYDMSGNVWEYCSDWYGDYEGDNLTNPRGPKSGDYRVIRGGCWNSSNTTCRVTYRQDNSLQSAEPAMGFRLVENKQK